MRVLQPEITESRGKIRVTASIRVDTPCNVSFPDELWYEFPDSYRDWVSERADGFATSMLPLAMYLGEPLEIEGEISPRLLRGMQEYQRVQSLWQPKEFERIEILAESVRAAETPASGATGCAFSGGVDSFHSLSRHLAASEPVEAYRISHLLLIGGFSSDGEFEDASVIESVAAAYAGMAQRLGVELLVARTNLSAIQDMNVGKASFDTALAGPAQILGRLFSRFFIPSSYRFDEAYPEGTSLMFDHLLGTENLEVIHDAPDVSRAEKVMELAEWEETWSALRVCWKGSELAREDGVIASCCRCEKCVRTMSTLKVIGALDRYTVFPLALRHRDVWRTQRRDRGWRIFAWEIWREAWRARCFAVFFDYSVSLLWSLLGSVLYEPFRAVHLGLERRFPAYAEFMERHHPYFRHGWRWIRKLESPASRG